MNMKQILRQHTRKIPRPIAYIGASEGGEDNVGVVMECAAKEWDIETILMMVATITKSSWYRINRIREKKNLDKVSMAEYSSDIYEAMLSNVKVEEIFEESAGEKGRRK